MNKLWWQPYANVYKVEIELKAESYCFRHEERFYIYPSAVTVILKVVHPFAFRVFFVFFEFLLRQRKMLLTIFMEVKPSQQFNNKNLSCREDQDEYGNCARPQITTEIEYCYNIWNKGRFLKLSWRRYLAMGVNKCDIYIKVIEMLTSSGCKGFFCAGPLEKDG